MSFSDEQLASQYPDNVVEKFATAFFRRAAYSGPGHCTIAYSPENTIVHCYTKDEFYYMLFTMFLIVTSLVLCFQSWCK